MNAFGRIVIIHPGAPGDLILAAPVAAALKKRFPEARMDSYSRFPLWDIFDNVTDRRLDLESSGVHRLFSEPDPSIIGPADLAITWMGAGDEAFVSNLARSTGAKTIAGGTSPPPGIHATDYLASQLVGLIENPVRAELTLKPSAKATDRMKSFLAGSRLSPDKGCLAVHPGSGSPAKCWPPRNFAETINRWRASGKPALIIQGPADETQVERVLSLTGDVPVLKCPDWGLLATLLHGSEAYLGNDSGVTHLAAAVGARTVAVFGPTDPAVWGPRGREVKIIQGKASCAPCSAEERRRCRNPECLESVTADRAWKILNRKSRTEVNNG